MSFTVFIMPVFIHSPRSCFSVKKTAFHGLFISFKNLTVPFTRTTVSDLAISSNFERSSFPAFSSGLTQTSNCSLRIGIIFLAPAEEMMRNIPIRRILNFIIEADEHNACLQ